MLLRIYQIKEQLFIFAIQSTVFAAVLTNFIIAFTPLLPVVTGLAAAVLIGAKLIEGLSNNESSSEIKEDNSFSKEIEDTQPQLSP